MSFYRRFLLIALCLSLGACTSGRLSQELTLGKINYTSGNYKQAFRQLLPVAVNGVAQAQYAVGYMYYYGYGVPQDGESGLFWMNRAAAQQYFPAVKALALIKEPRPVCDEYRSSACDRDAPSSFKGEVPASSQDEVLQSLPKATCKTVPDPALTTHFSREENIAPTQSHPAPVVKPAKLSSPVCSNYGLQLYGAYQFAQVKRFRQELSLEKQSHVWHTKNKGRDWYVLTYGKYDSIMQAKLAEDRLPSQLKELGPWVRKTSQLELVL